MVLVSLKAKDIIEGAQRTALNSGLGLNICGLCS